jgi:hypothetical protein
MRLGAILFVAAALGLAACGGSHASSSELSLRQALAKTAKASSARLALTDRVNGRVKRATGELDNSRNLGQLRFIANGPAGPQAIVITPQTDYYRFATQGWLRVDMRKVSRAARLSFLGQPEYLLSHLVVRRAVALGDGHFRVWANGLANPLDVWIAPKGYVSRLRTTTRMNGISVSQTVDLSDFGQRVNLAIPQSVSNTATASADGSFSFTSYQSATPVKEIH